MRILEVRDGFVKIESNEKLSLSSFLQIKSVDKKYIAQVIQTKKFEDIFVSYAKILFVYDGTFNNYDKTTPRLNAEVEHFSFDIYSKSMASLKPIQIGNFIENDEAILINETCFDKKTLISFDNTKNKNILISNLIGQFTKTSNVVVIDMLGTIEGNKDFAGINFKLPLNSETLQFMYEDCLNDATSDSKNLIKDIFADLASYSTTVPFLPFNALKTIVDDMVTKSHIFKLLVLKNKLAKFEEMGYFATNAEEVSKLSKILAKKKVTIDLSKLDSTFQNRYLKTIYSALKAIKTPTIVFINASNAIDKKSLKTILATEEISSVLIAHSRFKYISEIKNLFENYLIDPSFTNNEVFKTYKTFLNAMPKDTFLFVGEGSNYIPLISKLVEYNPELQIEGIVENEDQTLEEMLVTEDFESTENIEEIELNTIDSKDETSLAIEKKSENFIEKISEELEQTSTNDLDLFSDDEISVEDNESNENSDKLLEALDADNTLLTEDDLENSETESENLSTSNFESGFTKVYTEEKDFTDNSPEEENVELELNTGINEPPVINDETSLNIDEEIIPLEESSNEIMTEISEKEDIESNTEIEEIQTIEIPDDISELAEVDDLELETSEIISEENEAVVTEETETESQEESISIVEGGTETEIEEKVYDQTILKEFNDRESIEIDTIELTDEYEENLVTEDLNDTIDDLPEIVELDIEDLTEDDIVVDLSIEETDNVEDLDQQIITDVDKVFTTIKEESISDSDLDFIDELNGDTTDLTEIENGTIEELPELEENESEPMEFNEPLQEIGEDLLNNEPKEILETKQSATPTVPVYDADIPQEDIVVSDCSFEQGDIVFHAKHGNGVVEKMIKYGAKTLYSINFEKVGRRLLDPTVTELKKSN